MSTTDSGKMAPAGTGGAYRATSAAVGPSASGAEYVSTTDSGKMAPAGHGGAYRPSSSAVGPQSGKDTVATQDPGLQQPVSGGH